MSIGMKIFEEAVKNTRSLIAYHSKIEELRQAETEANEAGDIGAAMAAFAQRITIIAAGPGANLAQAVA